VNWPSVTPALEIPVGALGDVIAVGAVVAVVPRVPQKFV